MSFQDEEWRAKNPHLKEFFPYLDELNRESPRGKVLISAGFLEEQLRKILLAFMVEKGEADDLVEGKNAPLASFAARTSACYVLGLISEREHHDLVLIRRIRNDFAHKVDVSFKTKSVESRCRELSFKAADYETKDGRKVVVDAEGQFTTAAVLLTILFATRPHFVSERRCVPQSWPS